MRYFGRKLISTLTTLILASVLTFSVFQILPGDPALVILGVDASADQIESLRATMNLDGNAISRYFSWAINALQGDFGLSYKYQKPVASLISSAMRVTSQLALLSLVLALIIGIPLGIFLSKYNGKKRIIPLSIISQLGVSIPSFCVGILLIGIFTVKFNLLPSMGYVSFLISPWLCFKSLLLPALSIAIGCASVIIRYLRSNIINQSKKDYVRTCKSIGLSDNQILYKHILRNSLIPVITILGLLVADVLGGSIIIENVFSLPGIGKLITTSITSRDLPLIQALVLYLSIIVIICNFLVDVFYQLVDPRIRIR